MDATRRDDRRGFLKAAGVAALLGETALAQGPVNSTGKKIRVGHIGCGNVARNAYVKAMLKSPFIEVVSTCDIIPSRASDLAKRFNIPANFDHIDKQLKGPEFDLLVNTTSMPSHYAVNRAALEAGKHVWSEKPMALEVSDAQKLVDLARRKNLRLWGAPTCVTSPQFKFMAETMASGKLGKIYSGHAAYGHEGNLWSPWFFEKGGGSLYDLGVYNVTTLTGLLGPATSVVGMYGVSKPVRTVKPHDGPPQDVKVTADDNTMLIMEHDNAVYSHVQTGYTYFSGVDDKDVSRTDYTMDFAGAEGVMHLAGYDWGPHGVDIAYKGHRKLERFCTEVENYTWEGGPGYVAECLVTGKTSLMTPEHALHVLEVMNACFESQRTGRRIKIESKFPWPIIKA